MLVGLGVPSYALPTFKVWVCSIWVLVFFVLWVLQRMFKSSNFFFWLGLTLNPKPPSPLPTWVGASFLGHYTYTLVYIELKACLLEFKN
jgi:hypothetical protein